MKKLFIFLFLLLFFLFKPQVSFAEVIHSFDVNITAHKTGLMDITETINYDFESLYRHGIYRYIPIYSKVGDLYRILNINNVKVERDGLSENFTSSKNNEQIYLKIGNANKTITGPHVYKISYLVENGIGSNYEDHDEIYWNAMGNNWQVDIEKASAKVETDFNAKQTNFLCFQGAVGSKDSSCLVSQNLSTASQTLYPGEGLTVVAVYPVNTFPKSVLVKQLPKSFSEQAIDKASWVLPWVYIILYFLLPVGILLWYLKHKRKQRFGPPSVNFDIPKDEKGNILRPALAGTVDTAKLERDDVVATIFDLAIRKYLNIEETKKAIKLMPDEISQNLIKLKNADANLEDFEKTLFDRLFQNGDTVKLSDLRLDFYETFSQMETDVFSFLVAKKYYTKNPKGQKYFLIFLGIFSLCIFNILLAIVFFFLSWKLNGRTALGDEIDFKIDGLKLFLKSMDRNYKWQAEKLYTVEQMIPYAMALGYIDKFMESLKINYPNYAPYWYVGYQGSFYNSYSGFYTSMTTTIAPTSSSGSSGGSSGGGGGGGGGGSW